MANFSTGFGYDFYIVPLAAAEVDTAFTGVSNAAGFISTTTVQSPSAVISYASGVFSVGATALDMDGTDNPFRLYGLNDETKGFNITLPTSKTWSFSLSGVADFKDAGYHVLRLTEQNTVADALRVKVLRIGPTGTDEAIYGYGTLQGYTESNEAGSIVSWEATIQGYGPYRIDIDANVAPPTP
jgi:hypothetical protein